MRSRAGVGMTPPKVEGAPKPTSSVRISRMFGAPSGGVICGGQADVLSMAFGMIVPLNGRVGSGRTRLSGNSTAVGAPGAPRICCADAMPARAAKRAVDIRSTTMRVRRLLITPPGACERPLTTCGHDDTSVEEHCLENFDLDQCGRACRG